MASRYHFAPAAPSFGGQLGASLGRGLGQGLATLAESKLDKMITGNKQAQAKQQLMALGIPEKEAEFVSHQDPETQWQTARQWMIAGGAPEESVPKTLNDEWSFTPEQEAAAQQQVQQLLGQEAQREHEPVSPSSPLRALDQLGNPQLTAGGENIAQALAPQPSPQTAQVQKRPKGLGEAFKIAGEKTEKGGATPAQRFQQEKEIAKETLPTYKEITKAAHAAERSNDRLRKMEKLIEKGSLPYSASYRAFKSLSEDPIKIPVVGPIFELFAHSIGGVGQAVQRGLTSTDTEQFEKLSGEFIRDAKDIFGARITDADLRAFMQTVPTLAQTDNGKKAVIRNIRELNDLAIERNQIMKQIIKENGGKRPANLDILIDERMGPELNRITNEMKLYSRNL